MQPVTASILHIPWARIRPMPDQPREYFSRGDLDDLAGSLATIGQIVPAVVAAVKGDRKHDYELIDGQRRWHAVQMAGIETLKCEVIVEPDPERRYALSVMANFSRQAHHPMEVANACKRLNQTMSCEKIGKAIGRSHCYVQQHLGLLNLHPDIQGMLHPSVPKPYRLPLVAGIQLSRLPVDVQKDMITKIRQSELPPAKATRALVLAIPPEEAAKMNAGNPNATLRRDAYSRLFSVVQGAHANFTKYKSDFFRETVLSRNRNELAAVRSLLRKVIDHATRLLESLEGGASRDG